MKSLQKSDVMLQRQDVTFEYDGPKLKSVQIIYGNTKSTKIMPLSQITSGFSRFPFFPVNAPLVYLNCSKHTSGPLFQTIIALPISYSNVSAHLKSAVHFIGLDPNNFQDHSFSYWCCYLRSCPGFLRKSYSN